MTREERLNNPMGLKMSNETFQGEVIPSCDLKFKQFVTMAMGVRAGTRILLTYFRKYNLDTVIAIINRWAPPVENNTQAYINDVSARMGVSPDQPLDLEDRTLMLKLVGAIIYHENGESISPEDIATGVRNAFT